MKKFMKAAAAIMLMTMVVFAMGCHKENNGNENGGNNGGGGDDPTPTGITYTVTFNANGGTGEMQPQTFTEGEAKVLTANTFVYDNHVFVNWNTAADGSGMVYEDQQNITVSANITLYAQWKVSYVVTFNANGGTGEMQPQTFTEGETKALTANAFTYQCHTFVNWNTVADGSGTAYTDGQETTLAQNITLYAQWSLDNSINGHTWVDLGLPSGTLWATTNVGADTPEAYGDYFAWGETQPQANNAYSWSSYKYANGTSWGDPKLTKYCNNASYGNNGFTDTLTVLLPEDDAATANWGNGWRMPTQAELKELKDNCTVTWTIRNGVNGRLFIASNGSSVFLPAAGFRWDWDDGLVDDGSAGTYRSSSLYTDNPSNAWDLDFDSGNLSMSYGGRHVGHSVRPVCSLSQK